MRYLPMYQKKFVSIYFTSDRIQVVKLNSKKSAVVKYATFGFPQGTIVNHKVSDPKLLSNTLKTIWSQMKIREKAVGLIVPEFSTYTKTLTLPELSDRELDEAVRWQASEQLPFEKDKAILDWKIIKDTEKEKTVLISAIASDVLTGYVDAVSAAGLFPLSVETPALSLIRTLSNNDKKRLIVYRGNSEAIMLVTQGQSIIGSSVLSTKDEQMAISTAIQIAYHYSPDGIEEIFVGGYSYGQEFYSQLQEKFKGIQTHQLVQAVGGMTSDQIQEYLVPISLQMEDPQAPEDEHSINLLPPSWVKHYQDQLLTRQAWTISWLTAVMVAVCLAISTFAFMIMNSQLNNLKAESTVVLPESKEVFAQIDDANSLIKNLSALSDYDIYPQTYVNVITKAKPPGVEIQNYEINLEGGVATVSGFALRRQDLVTFKDELEKSEFFDQVDVPISSLIAEENIEFKISLIKVAVQPAKKVQKLQL